MITTFYPPYSFGGDAIFVRALSRQLANRGHQVTVIHCKDSYFAVGGKPPAEVVTPDASITVHGLSSPFQWLSPLATQQTGFPLFNGAEIKRILDEGQFDVTHFHNVSLLGGPGVLSYGAGLKLYTIHEYWLLCPMHVLFRNNREPCEVKQCIRCSLHFHRPPQLWRYTNLIHQALQRIDAFLAPTEFTRALHLASGLPMYIETLPNFHDAWEPAPEDIPPAGRPFFLYVGRLEKLKGIHTLLPAFRSYPGADLLIAGEGSEAASLHQAARGISNIVFLGKVGREHLAHYYRSAIAVLVPSLGMEVFPLVILEALAAHTPLIARARGPLQEIVESSGCGLLFREDSELPGLLARMQNQPAERARMGEAGYTKWCAEWTSEAHLTRYLALIERLRAAKASGLRH